MVSHALLLCIVYVCYNLPFYLSYLTTTTEDISETKTQAYNVYKSMLNERVKSLNSRAPSYNRRTDNLKSDYFYFAS